MLTTIFLMFETLFSTEGLISLFTLCVLEIILGIDNIIFVSIVAARLPKSQQKQGRMLGMLMALIARIGLLMAIGWIVSLDSDLFVVFGNGISGRDLILLLGGLFLIIKSTSEIHEKMAGEEEDENNIGKKQVSFGSVILQIVLIDIVFSFDSILTAVGLVKDIGIMILAVVISLGFMLFFVNAVSEFVEKNPTVKMLALSFLIMIGTLLIGEGLGYHLPKGYVYFAMAFSFGVELLNMRIRVKKPAPQHHTEKE